jgi:hypothetical protein
VAARSTEYNESLGEDSTTSATYQDKVAVTFTPDASSDYYLFWSCLIIGGSTSEDVFTRLYNSTDAVVLAEQNQEHRTTGGTPYRTAHGIAKFTSSGSPGSTTFKIQYASEVGGTSSFIKQARLLIVKAHADDEYAEYLTAETTTSNSYVDTSCALTFTPATTGDYLIFSSADLKSSSSGDNYFLKLLDPAGAAIGEMSCVNRDGTNFNPWTTMVRQNLTNSSKTFKLQWHRTAAGTLTLQNQRILALRLDTFDNEYYAEDRTRATTTSTSYVTDVTLTATPEAKEHIVFNSALVDNSTTSVSTVYQFYEDSTGTGEFNHRVNTGETSSGQRALFVAYRKTLPAQSISWTRQHLVITGATSGIDEDAISVIQTEASGGGTDATGTCTGVAATGSPGTATASAFSQITLAGVTATGAPGSVTATASSQTTLAGVAGLGTAGTVTADIIKTPTGVEATGQVGTLTATASSQITLTGVAGTGAAGTTAATADAPVVISGVAGTTALGTVAPTASSQQAVTGVGGTSGVGDVTTDASTDAAISGVGAAGTPGTIQSTATANITGTGVSGDAGAGTVTADNGVQALYFGGENEDYVYRDPDAERQLLWDRRAQLLETLSTTVEALPASKNEPEIANLLAFIQDEASRPLVNFEKVNQGIAELHERIGFYKKLREDDEAVAALLLEDERQTRGLICQICLKISQKLSQQPTM